MNSFNNNLITTGHSVKDALEQLNLVPNMRVLFVLDDEGRLKGTLTDGDVRRGLLEGKSITQSVVDIMHTDFKFVKQDNYHLSTIKAFKEKQIHVVPVLDQDGRILRIADLSQKRSLLPLDAVIMAGGEGRRLRPMTLSTPKPLLKVGGKPIIQYNVERLALYGVHHLNISIKYLGEQLSNYFGNGEAFNLDIRYVTEEEFLGTIGAIRRIEKFYHEHILVMNSDLLTNINFEDMFLELLDKQGDMIVATIPYEVKIPYGVLEIEEEHIVSLKEKPTYTYYSNAGIYILKSELVDLIPQNEQYNATDLMELLIAMGKKVLHFPILGYWLDIGKPDDFEKAQRDIHYINF